MNITIDLHLKDNTDSSKIADHLRDIADQIQGNTLEPGIDRIELDLEIPLYTKSGIKIGYLTTCPN